jgi:hypothetical protein
MIPIYCWDFVKLPEIINALVKANFKGLRIFFNLRDLPYNPNLKDNSSHTDWQLYINHCFTYMPNGMHTFTFEGSPSPDVPKDMMRDSFLLCKKLNWLPIVCIGTSEESVSGDWIGRVPKKECWIWLGRFCKEFAIYIKENFGFSRADLEVWNEPSKLQGLGLGWNKYCDLALIMATNWKVVKGNNSHEVLGSVAFGMTFASAPIVILTTLGYKASIAPTLISDLTNYAKYTGHVFSITTTGFQVVLRGYYSQGTDYTLSSSNYHGYSWVAIGQLI